MSDEMERAERRKRLVELVRDGRYSWEQMAERAGYNSRSAAHQDYHRMLRKREEEIAATLDDTRREHLEGLIELRRVAAEIMRNGGDAALAALDRVVKVDAQIAQLLGLNAPTQIEAGGKVAITVEGVSREDMEKLT